MKLKKLLALVLACVMVLSLVACGGDSSTTTNNTTESNNDTTTVPDTTDAPVVTPVESSVNFEDGNCGFVSVYAGMANSDASTIEVADYNGSKALKVTNGSGKVPYVAIDVWSLLGENAANVASIEMTMGIENPDGKFYACSGEVALWSTNSISKVTHAWSVYLETKNPKTAVVTLDTANGEVFSADVAPLMIVSLKTDNGATAGAANATLYIDDIRFLDASGNLIAADTTATFAEPDGFGGAKDMSNLAYLKADAVVLEGMSGITGTGWGQNGVEMTEDFINALVPGSVIEIEYSTTSATGDLWIVMPDASIGWSRIEQQTAAKNNSCNICQITYEQIAAVCGEDVSTWGARLQCESDGDWEVYSVKVGKNAGLVTSAKKTVWAETSITGTAWGQNGIDLTEDMIAALVPGTMIEVQYTTTSATGDMWIVMPDAACGWTRVQQQTAACNGSVMQITYEQIAEACQSEDKSTWGTRLQLESDGDWEAYSISLVSSHFVNTTNNVAIEGFACTGTGWGQNGIELTADQLALLVPGSVITIQYTTASATGDIWIVMPDAAIGWSRIEQQTAACDGSTCQITYEQIAAVCGEDPSTWGTRIQCESDADWEVFSLSIGTAG